MVQACIAGDACGSSNFQAVADLLDPVRYINACTMVHAEEIRASVMAFGHALQERKQRGHSNGDWEAGSPNALAYVEGHGAHALRRRAST